MPYSSTDTSHGPTELAKDTAAEAATLQHGGRMERIRFVIITVPPRGVTQQIDRFRVPAADVSGSRIALAYPPHVTLRTGALVPAADVAEYVGGLRETLSDFRPFEIRTAGLISSTYREAGEKKHFVGYAIEKSGELLSLHHRLLTYVPWIKREQPPFEPHLSIAYGDLSAEGRSAIMHLVEKNPGIAPGELSWSCDNVGLYHRVGGEWQPFAVITAGTRVAR